MMHQTIEAETLPTHVLSVPVRWETIEDEETGPRPAALGSRDGVFVSVQRSDEPDCEWRWLITVTPRVGGGCAVQGTGDTIAEAEAKVRAAFGLLVEMARTLAGLHL